MVEVIPLADPAWAAFLDAHPDATCFHLPQWSQLLASSYGYRGFIGTRSPAWVCRAAGELLYRYAG